MTLLCFCHYRNKKYSLFCFSLQLRDKKHFQKIAFKVLPCSRLIMNSIKCQMLRPEPFFPFLSASCSYWSLGTPTVSLACRRGPRRIYRISTCWTCRVGLAVCSCGAQMCGVEPLRVFHLTRKCLRHFPSLQSSIVFNALLSSKSFFYVPIRYQIFVFSLLDMHDYPNTLS